MSKIGEIEKRQLENTYLLEGKINELESRLWEYEHNASIINSERDVLKNEMVLLEKKLNDCENLIRQLESDIKEKVYN